MPIPLADGHTVSLGEVGRIVQQPGLSMLTGSQLRYTVDVLAYRETLPVSLLSERAQAAASAVLPPGVGMEDKGDNDAGGHSTSCQTVVLPQAQVCTPDSNYALNAATPVKNGSTYSVTLTWTSTGIEKVKIEYIRSSTEGMSNQGVSNGQLGFSYTVEAGSKLKKGNK